MSTSTKVPRRSYGEGQSSSSCINPNLPSTLPILGLGCSSFSTFFFRKQDLEDQNNTLPIQNPPQRNHPMVQNWIQTIQHAVVNCGINLLDTAPWYGHGSSEVVIGYAMEQLLEQKNIKRDEILINTKVGRYDADPMHTFDFSAKRVQDSVLLSIDRMKCSYIDVIQLHDPEFTPSIDLLVHETIPALAKLRDETQPPLVRAIGMTGYPLSMQRLLIHRSWTEHGIQIDQSLSYCHFNLHDRSLFNHHGDDDAFSFADFCKSKNIGLLTAAPLSMGLLTHDGPPDWHPASHELKAACKAAAEYCANHNINISNLALLFAFGQERIPCTILGMKNVDEVNRAVDITSRFVAPDDHDDGGASILSLDAVLTEKEKEVLDYLLDYDNGPFAAVAKSGQFQWDGMEEGNTFWQSLAGGKAEGERRMRAGTTYKD